MSGLFFSAVGLQRAMITPSTAKPRMIPAGISQYPGFGMPGASSVMSSKADCTDAVLPLGFGTTNSTSLEIFMLSPFSLKKASTRREEGNAGSGASSVFSCSCSATCSCAATAPCPCACSCACSPSPAVGMVGGDAGEGGRSAAPTLPIPPAASRWSASFMASVMACISTADGSPSVSVSVSVGVSVGCTSPCGWLACCSAARFSSSLMRWAVRSAPSTALCSWSRAASLSRCISSSMRSTRSASCRALSSAPFKESITSFICAAFSVVWSSLSSI
mmetsp:Transcript_48050/g.120313  ORF Transcript_48050/g.120313 Transcript_48050/m.120313 type:complete len:276 (-) Transcript_48050:995-1822(-)